MLSSGPNVVVATTLKTPTVLLHVALKASATTATRSVTLQETAEADVAQDPVPTNVEETVMMIEEDTDPDHTAMTAHSADHQKEDTVVVITVTTKEAVILKKEITEEDLVHQAMTEEIEEVAEIAEDMNVKKEADPTIKAVNVTKDVKAEVAALNKNEVETRKWEMVKDKDLTPMTNKEGQTEAVHKVLAGNSSNKMLKPTTHPEKRCLKWKLMSNLNVNKVMFHMKTIMLTRSEEQKHSALMKDISKASIIKHELKSLNYMILL